jgi:hypothetical protein
MHEQLSTQPNRTFKITVLVCLALLVGAVAWLMYRVENLPAASTEKTVTSNESEDDADDTTQYVNWDTTVTAGGGAFMITFPDGWGPLLKGPDGIRLASDGTKQPEIAAGKKIAITEVDGFGSDSPSVFSIIAGDDFAVPRGDVSEFTVGKGEDAMIGKKYKYTYPEDDIVGIGTLRLQGDRDYEYVFTLKDGKELHIYYSVYGNDPRNQINIVYEIVRTIRPPETGR